MFSGFQYEAISLKDILLDDRNPRIVTQNKLSSQEEIVKYLFDHEKLEKFIKKIVSEGKNRGAERPYVIKNGKKYVVIEGNTRIAAYKILSGLLGVPVQYNSSVINISQDFKNSLLSVDCSVAPSRDALLPIMASAHFGLGDKSKWGYLGSRKAVYDEMNSGKSIVELAKAFDRTEGQIRELVIEYKLYLRAIDLPWTKGEMAVLLDPSVEFNPPVRFLQSSGHKAKVGISYDVANLDVIFSDPGAEKKFKHLLDKLVIHPRRGLGATATYEEVFADYEGDSTSSGEDHKGEEAKGHDGSDAKGGSTDPEGKSGSSEGKKKASVKSGILFSYPVTINSNLIIQLMKEAKDLNCIKFPSAGTFLLRNIVESILKEIIDQQKANPASKLLDLEGSISLCQSNNVSLDVNDKKILKEFNKTHVSYLNLGAHGTVIPNYERVMAARDCIDQFVKRNV